MEPDDLTALGPWADSDAAMASTARASTGIGADADLSPEIRFKSGVAKLVRLRLACSNVEGSSTKPAIFLLAPNIGDRDLGATPKRVPMLDNGLTNVVGRLWFVSAAVVAGNYVDIEPEDDDAIFAHVTETLCFGDVPAIVFDPRTAIPSVRYYPNGLNAPEQYEDVRVGGELSLDRILEVLDKIHMDCLVTPEAQAKAGSLWQNNSKNWASKDAEDLVQLYIRAGLTGAFPTCVARHEQTQISGRLDIELEERDTVDRSKVVRHAVLELKILRSFGSTGTAVTEKENCDWIEEGVRQAATYRDDRGALAAALCCFDMRVKNTGDQCFSHVMTLAASLSVTLRNWFLFSTSKKYRRFHTRSH